MEAYKIIGKRLESAFTFSTIRISFNFELVTIALSGQGTILSRRSLQMFAKVGAFQYNFDGMPHSRRNV